MTIMKSKSYHMFFICYNNPKRMIFFLLHKLMQIVRGLLLLLLNVQFVFQLLLCFPQNHIILNLSLIVIVLIQVLVVVDQVLDVV